MKILITGGAGFIGSHLCQKLLDKDYEVICLDNFDSYYDPKLKHKNIEQFLLNKNFKLIEGSICDEKLVQNVIRPDIEYVFHCAAQPGVRISVNNPRKPHEINTTGTLNILQACLKSNVKKLINASSSSVYGKVEYLPFDEDHPKMPVSPYGVSKLAAEQYCRVFTEVYGLRTTSLRFFTVYGARMRPDLAISIFTRKALNNEKIEIFGTGEKTRDFTYVDDVVEASLLAGDKGDGQTYNIGSGNRVTINELAQKIVNITNSKSRIIHTLSQKGDAEHTWANIDKARRDLGYVPKTNIEDGLRKYTSWFLNEGLAWIKSQ
ncbi:SDR family oxidoreductase [Patescibacteria group bacterium]|nr:SDR family oxidoreductase [Patescibacteria group bacterium]